MVDCILCLWANVLARGVMCQSVVYYDSGSDNDVYYIPIADTTLELSVFWPSDTESRINELRFSESISLANVGYLLLRRRYVK